MDSKTNRIKVMLDDKECGEGIYHICYEQETKGCAIPSFHIDAFILKATLTAG